MTIKLTFLGAARSVTGSRYLVDVDGTRLLVDCGMYQERQFRSRDWEPFLVDPRSINAVLLTHAHLDHSGLLPKLVRDGLRAPIYCTSATGEIAEVILLDSASLQEEDAEIKRNRHRKESRKGPYPEVPLYTVHDAESCIPLFARADYKKPIDLAPGVDATFFDAGHTLGSAALRLRLGRGAEERTVLFSGDLGRPGKPILNDPTTFSQADYVVMESTYGDREIESPENNAGELAEVINWTVKAGGNVIIPSFALERAQELLYYLNELLLKNAIPHLMVFVDSPMAVNITEIFRRHHELMDKDTNRLLHLGKSPFDFAGLNMVRSIDQSKAINHIAGTVIVIAGSGMCTGGRIKHHLVANISRPDSSILFVGYQAAGTLGREIVDGAAQVRIFGENYPVEAKVVYLHGFSGHADQQQLLKWLTSLTKPPSHVFITHGESDVTEGFAGLVREKTGWNATAPEYGDEVVLD
jgi:metallo-beta-lactamase family protein